MKRDLDLVRAILFKMEEEENVHAFTENDSRIKIEGYSRELVRHHLEIMSQAGLLHADHLKNVLYDAVDKEHIIITVYYSISWKGHEFLSALRDETRWKEVKTIMVRAGGFVTEVALDVAKEMIKQAAMKVISP